MNVLVLITDQQRYDTIEATGSSFMQTPNLNRLVNEGCYFTNAYTPVPICVPARHCLLTGCAPRDHGFANNQGIHENHILDNNLPTYPRVFNEKGYFTAAVGKMHFKPTREHHGYTHMSLMEEIPGHIVDDSYAKYLAENDYADLGSLHGVRPLAYHLPQQSPVPERMHENFWIANKTKKLIDENSDRPFLITASWIQPHPPIHLPEPWASLYDDVKLPESKPPKRHAPYPESDPRFADDVSPELLQKLKRFYYGSISMIDAAVGEIIDHLEAKKKLDDTLILFTSDHGEMLGDLGMLQKTVPYEPSCHIPFLIRYPRLFEAGSHDERFVDLMDVLPTLVDAAGIQYPAKQSQRNYTLQGESLIGSSKLRNREEQWVEYGFDTQRWVSLRNKRYKYIYFYSDGLEQFFNLEADPDETKNLVKSKDLPSDEYDTLKKRCIELEKERGLIGNTHRWGFNHRKRNDSSTEGGQFFGSFANLQFPNIGSNNPEAFIEELKAALPWEEDRKQIRDSDFFETYAENWRHQFISRYKSTDYSSQKLVKMANDYLREAFEL